VSHWPSFPFCVIVIMILSANEMQVMCVGTSLIVAVARRVGAGYGMVTTVGSDMA